MRKFVVVHLDEDGETHFEHLAREELEKRLNEEYWGSAPRFLGIEDFGSLSSKSGLLIIEGSVVAPRPVDVVKRWGVP